VFMSYANVRGVPLHGAVRHGVETTVTVLPHA
jgi:hypothetical protein